ncbi:MAG: hypothetical protein AAGI01_18325, partial [Myxococcota bacterium]
MRALVDLGVARAPYAGTFMPADPDLGAWVAAHQGPQQARELASLLVRHHAQRIGRDKLHARTPMMMRLYAMSGARQHTLLSADVYADW